MTKKHDEIAERAKYLVENFSNKNGTGSVYTVAAGGGYTRGILFAPFIAFCYS